MRIPTPYYLGPYYIARRTSNGNTDAEFGDNGYVSTFGNSSDNSHQFTSLCIDPGTRNIVVVGKESSSNGNDSPTLGGCSVVDEGAGNSGAIVVGGVDDAASSSRVLASKISSSGGYDTVFGSNGVVEYRRIVVSGDTDADAELPDRDPRLHGTRLLAHHGLVTSRMMSAG
jgi:hypothetical protein